MSPFKALETTIKKQDDEIERLKNTQKVRTPIKAKGCPRGFLNFNIKTLMTTDGFFWPAMIFNLPIEEKGLF